MKSSNINNPFSQNKEIAQTIDNTEASVDSQENVINEEPVKEDTTPVESNALVNEQESNEEIIKYFESLPELEKSKEVNVINVNPSGSINVEVDGDKLEITLIGIDFKYSDDLAINKIKFDLLNKKVKVAFDKLRSENGKTYAYVYSGKSLYNAELLKTGLVTLKTERKNIELNKDLANAQAYARQNSLGVWKK
jgi:endonuclease YncB( thermonuclease family)